MSTKEILTIKDTDTGKTFTASDKAWLQSYKNTMSKKNRKKKRFTIVSGNEPTSKAGEGKKKNRATGAKSGAKAKGADTGVKPKNPGAEGQTSESGESGKGTDSNPGEKQ